MVERVFLILTVASAVGCGLIAGVFLAFSSFVMRALARIPAESGIAAMQSINVTAINPLFLGVFLGTGAASAAVAVRSVIVAERGATLLASGSLLYLVGTIVVTMAFNVPRNNALARAEPAGAESDRLWAEYLRSWTRWNHVRTLSAGTGAAMFTLALAAR